MLRSIIFLFILTSCTQLKTQPSLKQESVEELLNKIKIVGEGRGRLGFKQQSYVFSYDALLRDSEDWLLAITIPLKGEEVMTLEDLKSPVNKSAEIESLEDRINQEVDPVYRGKILPEIRSMIRFLLVKDLGMVRSCQLENQSYICQLDSEKFIISVFDKEIRIKKLSHPAVVFELIAQNLTTSFFTKTHFTFHSETASKSAPPVLSLELFWK